MMPFRAMQLRGSSGGGAPTGFRYWRLTVTDARSGGVPHSTTPGAVRVSEFQLFVGATKYPTANMTGASSPSPLVASASSTNGSGLEPWRAFNTGTDDSSRWLSSDSSGPDWIQIDLGSGNEINPTSAKIAPDAVASSGYIIVAFNIAGSNTGSFSGEETIFYSASGLTTGWFDSTLRTFTF